MNQWVLLFAFLLLTGTACTGTVVVYRLLFLEDREPQHARGLWLLVSVCILAFAFRMGAVPHMQHVFYDEMTYLDGAQNIHDYGRAENTLKGSHVAPEKSGPMKLRVGHSLLLALWDVRAFPSEQRGFLLSIIAGVLSIGLAFRIVARLSRDLSLAWWTSVILAFLPVHIKYSTCLSGDSSGLFFFLLFLMCLTEWALERKELFLLGALLAGAYGVLIKPVYLIFLLSGLAVAAGYLAQRKEWRAKDLMNFFYYAGCVLLPIIVIVSALVAVEPSGTDPLFSLQKIRTHLFSNLDYFMSLRQSNLIAVILAAIGVVGMLSKERGRLLIAMFLWFVGGFFLITGFFAGGMSYGQSPDSERFFFLIIFPFAVLAAQGACSFRATAIGRIPAAGAFLILLLVANTFYSSSKMIGLTRHRYLYEQTAFLRSVADKIPEEAYVVYEPPTVVTALTTKKTLAASLFIGETILPGSLLFKRKDATREWGWMGTSR